MKNKYKNMIRKLEIVAMVLILTVTIAVAQSVSQRSDGVQSSEASIGQGKVTSWDNIPKERPGSPHERDKPMKYEIDKGKLDELKRKPFVPSGKVPSKDEKDTPGQLAPNLIFGFDALDNWDNAPSGYIVRPPDPNIATGPNHVGAVVNYVIAFYTKSGSLTKKALLQDWFSNIFNGACSTCMITDPRIIYDQNEGHWLVVALGIDSSTMNSWYLLSVSQTSDPIGSWWNYKLDGDAVYNSINVLADYPDLGIDGISSSNGGAVYITSNQFDSSDIFRTSMVNILPKSSLYSGAGFSYLRAYGMSNSDGSQVFTLRAAQTFGDPGGEFLINTKSGGSNSVTLWKIVPTYPPADINLVRQATISIGSYSPPPDAKQKRCAQKLDTIDNRMYNTVYQNGDIYAAFTEAYNWGSSGTVASIRYLKIDTTSNTPELNVKYGANGYYYWFPAIMTDDLNNIVLVFASSSSNEYAGIRYTARKTTDTTTQPSAILKSGSECITGYRWGDYFGIANDPSDNSIWIYGEWAKNLPGISSAWDWGTYVGKVTN